MSESNEKLTIEDLKKGTDNYCRIAIAEYIGKLGFSEAVASPFIEEQNYILYALKARPADWGDARSWGGYSCQVHFPGVLDFKGGILPLKENLTLVEHFPDDDGVSKFEIYHEPFERVIEAFDVRVDLMHERIEFAIDLMHAANKNIAYFMDRTEIATTLEGKEVEASRMAMKYLLTATNSIKRFIKQKPDYWMSDVERFEEGFIKNYDLSNIMDSLGLTGDLPKEQQAEKIAEVVNLAAFTDKDPWIVAQTLEERNVNVTESQLNELGKQAIDRWFALTAQDVLDAVPELGKSKDVDRGR